MPELFGHVRGNDRHDALMRQAGLASTLPAVVMVLRVAAMSHRLGRLTDVEYADVIKKLDYQTIVISSKGQSTGRFMRSFSRSRRR